MAKTHSEWSASASARNMACPGALALIAKSEPGAPSIYAAWGTLMHSINESCLHNNTEPGFYLGHVEKVDGFDIEVDDEMIDASIVCVDYVRALAAQPGAKLWLEEKFDLAPLGLPMQAGGTCDAVVWMPEIECVEIVDYKGGKGKIVEVADNTQLCHYGLGPLVTHPELPIKRIKMTIIQPRAPHEDGVIRSVEMHPIDLVDFANDIDRAMRRSMAAMQSYHAGEVEAWGAQWLNIGDHCQFCPALAICPAVRAKTQEMVGVFWDDNIGAQLAVMENTPEAVERDLDVIELMEQWIAARRAYAHQLAEGGHQFDNWTLVEKNGHRRWNDKDDLAAAKIMAETGLALAECYVSKLKSPAGIEKVLGKAKGKVAHLFHTPVIGKDLVRRSKAASRRPAQSLVDEFFETEAKKRN